MAQQNPYSLENFLGFIQNNFSLLVIVGLFFMGGFFFGSVWTENKMIRGGAGEGTVAGTGAGAPGAAAPEGGAAQTPPNLTDENLLATADAVGAGRSDMEACIAAGEMSTKVSANMEAASQAGVSGTPHTIIMLDGEPVDVIGGALPFAEVASMIEGHLAGTATGTPPAGTVPPITGDDYVKGNADARVALVEYGDYACSFCQQFHGTMNQVMAEYGNDVAWVYRHYPFLGQGSISAATAAECVGEIAGAEAFWEFTDSLFM
ncbi:MAG: thioredoxin domain-containing protein [Patescibacteria group bacterium]